MSSQAASPSSPANLNPTEWMPVLYKGHPNLPSGYVEYRFLPFGKATQATQNRLWIKYPEPGGLSSETIIARQAEGKNIYFGLAVRRVYGKGDGTSIYPSHLLYMDLDLKGTPSVGGRTDVENLEVAELRAASEALYARLLARCAALRLPPLAVVYTGHGLQVYWSRALQSSLNDTKRFNQALVRTFGQEFGVDHKAVDAARVFRLPGTLNLKNPQRPIPVEVWHFNGTYPRLEDARLERLVMDRSEQDRAAPSSKTPVHPGSGGQDGVIQVFNRQHSIHDMLSRYGYTRDGDRYTRPGDGASGRDVVLLENGRGVLCSYHHSSNDVIASSPDAAHLIEPFDLFRLYEHNGEYRSAVKAAAAELGFSYAAQNDQTLEQERDAGSPSKQPPAGTRTLEYAREDGAELWHDQAGNAYLSTSGNGHREHYRLPSRGARDYLQTLFYGRERRALNAQAQGEALGLMQALARRQGEQHHSAVRLAHLGGKTYLDLGTPNWEVVVVGEGGWRVLPPHDCPVRFTRPAGSLPLPVPVPGGNLGMLREYINTDDRGYVLCVAWLLGALSGLSPYPVLALSGEQGTGKSTAASVLRKLLDPHQADRRRAPKEERDLYVAAQSSHVLSLDNLSSIPGWLSDALCVLSTGGAFAARTLYSDSEETILEAVRPVIVNGIPDLLARPDLAERALTITLYRISPERRRAEKEVWARYESDRPRLIGALLSALAHGLQHLEDVRLEESPRLADFARLVVAAEERLPWSQGEFLNAYGQMQGEAAGTVLDGEPVAEALRAFIDETGEWTGTVKKLLGILEAREYAETRPPLHWPRTARALGTSLRRLAPALSQTGYTVTPIGRSKEGERYSLSRSTEMKYTSYTKYMEADLDKKN